MNTQTVWYEKLLQFLKQYKLAGVFLLLGVCLMVLSGMRKEPLQETPQETLVYDLQLQMEQLLEHVDGAGSVKVLLSYETGPVNTYQENVTVFSNEDETERKTQTVLVSSGGAEMAIPLKTIYPTYKGAVVIAEGADRPAVKLNLIQAVSSLTGLGMDQITVIKMRGY